MLYLPCSTDYVRDLSVRSGGLFRPLQIYRYQYSVGNYAPRGHRVVPPLLREPQTVETRYKYWIIDRVNRRTFLVLLYTYVQKNTEILSTFD